MLVQRVDEICFDDVFLELPGFAPARKVVLKLEHFHPSGSIKFTTAREILDDLEETGAVRPGDLLVESSSGNLGVALAMLCAVRGYRFACVVDPNALPANLALIQAYGGVLHRVDTPDTAGGYLKARIDRVQDIIASDRRAVWSNQYANPANPRAHRRHTAPAILRNVPDVDIVVVGAGTTGTLLGCLQHFRQAAPRVEVVAADAIGSVTFGGAPAPRRLPGVGSSLRPELARELDRLGRPRLHQISEVATIAMCRQVLRAYGLLAGASTGTVLCALQIEAAAAPPGACIVGLSPDGGERYLETVFAAPPAGRDVPEGLTSPRVAKLRQAAL